MEDSAKVAIFDRQHQIDGPRWGRQNAAAKELASHYSLGNRAVYVYIVHILMYWIIQVNVA